MDGGAWWATVHGVATSQSQLSDFTFTFHFHTMEKEMVPVYSEQEYQLYLHEGNGNPLQCSCLEILRNRGDWWAAVYGVTQSQTQLERLSSSSIVY